VFLIFFCTILFLMPEGGGYMLEHANFIPADSLKTPQHIAPVWYFTPFYAILRAVPDKLMGVIAMGAAIVVLFLLPWLDRCNVKSIRYRGNIFKINLAAFVVAFLFLGWLGMQPPTPLLTWLARIFSITYFGFFVVLYVTSKNEPTKPVPERVT